MERTTTLVLLCCLALGTGCASAPQRSTFMAQSEHMEVSEPMLRVMLYDFIFEFSTNVALAADAIAERYRSDVAGYRRTMRWKLSAGAEARRAAFQPDVLIGFMDVWALAAQQREFFESGEGKDYFGEHQQIALDATVELERSARKLASVAADETGAERGDQVVADWVRLHPIRAADFRRKSIATLLVEEYGPKGSRGMSQSVANMEDSVEDLMQRMTIYSEQAPREILWESGLLADQLLEHPHIAALFQDVRESREAVLLMSGVAQSFPALLDRQRELAFDDVRLEREAMMADLQQERIILLEALTREREAVMQEMNTMYEGGLGTLRSERETVMEELPRVAASSFAASDTQMRALVDYLFWRLGQGVAALLLLGGFVATLLSLLRRARRKPQAGDGDAAS